MYAWVSMVQKKRQPAPYYEDPDGRAVLAAKLKAPRKKKPKLGAQLAPPVTIKGAFARIRRGEMVDESLACIHQALIDVIIERDGARVAGRAAGLKEAADDMERVMAFGVMRIPVVGMAQTLRAKADQIVRKL